MCLNNDSFVTLMYLRIARSIKQEFMLYVYSVFVTLYGFMVLNHALASCLDGDLLFML